MKVGNYKVGTKQYFKPTPKILRVIGDSLLLIGTTVTSISAFTMPPIVTAIAAGCTLLGKLITNFVAVLEK
jgi:hypothetical protein